MAETTGLELVTNRPFQRRFWRIQRVGWVIMALILLAALLGLTGKGGPLARASVTGPEGEVVYPRVARWQTADELEVRFSRVSAGEATVQVGVEFGRVFQVEGIQPEPSSSIVIAGGQQLTFEVGPGEGEKSVTINVRPTQPELATRIPIRINGGDPMRITPVVLP